MTRPGRLMLIVDDDSWTRYALAGIVRKRGYLVLTTGTVEGGIALLAEEPDCLILDLCLPDGRGEAILRKVREEGRHCRVVVCTVICSEEQLATIRSLSPDAVFNKPVDVDQILHICEGHSCH